MKIKWPRRNMCGCPRFIKYSTYNRYNPIIWWRSNIRMSSLISRATIMKYYCCFLVRSISYNFWLGGRELMKICRRHLRAMVWLKKSRLRRAMTILMKSKYRTRERHTKLSRSSRAKWVSMSLISPWWHNWKHILEWWFMKKTRIMTLPTSSRSP